VASIPGWHDDLAAIAAAKAEFKSQNMEELMPSQQNQQAIADLFAEHMDAELAGDLETTLATMTENPHLVNVPSMVAVCLPIRYFRDTSRRLTCVLFWRLRAGAMRASHSGTRSASHSGTRSGGEPGCQRRPIDG